MLQNRQLQQAISNLPTTIPPVPMPSPFMDALARETSAPTLPSTTIGSVGSIPPALLTAIRSAPDLGGTPTVRLGAPPSMTLAMHEPQYPAGEPGPSGGFGRAPKEGAPDLGFQYTPRAPDSTPSGLAKHMAQVIAQELESADPSAQQAALVLAAQWRQALTTTGPVQEQAYWRWWFAKHDQLPRTQ